MGSKINLSVKGNFSSEKKIILIFAPKTTQILPLNWLWTCMKYEMDEVDGNIGRKSILEKIVDEKGPKVKWEPK